MCPLNLSHASLLHVELFTKVSTCWDSRCPLKYIFHGPVTIERCFSLFNTLSGADEAGCSTKLYLSRKTFYTLSDCSCCQHVKCQDLFWKMNLTSHHISSLIVLQKGYDELQTLVPTCQQTDGLTSQKLSKAAILQRCKLKLWCHTSVLIVVLTSIRTYLSSPTLEKIPKPNQNKYKNWAVTKSEGFKYDCLLGLHRVPKVQMKNLPIQCLI